MSKKFQKNKEDFICEHCGREVQGDGFTNHCPGCLWSKHVDVYPGDRQALCFGLMEPVDVIHETQKYYIMHTCVKCNYIKKNKVDSKDDFDRVIDIARKRAAKS